MVEYALRAVFDLASQPASHPIKIADIARRQSIPQKFLGVILASLKQGGFVESRRGRRRRLSSGAVAGSI